MWAERGWSLVELILVIVIIGILAAFIGPMLLRSIAAYDATDATVATYAKMRYAMERMARELREIRRDPANSANYDVNVATASATNLTFRKTDGTEVTINSSGGVVTVTYTGGILGAGSASGTLTDRVSAFALAYYQHNGTTAATSAANVEFVQISMTLTEGANDFVNRVRVGLRNPQ